MRRLLVVILNILFCFGSVHFGILPAAEKYPVKPIDFIVPMEAGSDGDVITRPVMQRVSEILGQPVMIVNKPGGGSSIGYRELYRAKPDGYTIGWGSATLISNKLQGISPIDYHDFTMLGTFATYFPVIVAATNTKRPFKTIQEVMSFAKAHPGEVSVATGGIGQNWWVASMSFLKGTGLEMNIIPQPGTGAMSMAQVAGGHTDLAVVGLGSAKSMVEGGQVRLLVNLGEERSPAPYDKIPTMKELGYDVSYESTNFAMGPPKLPKDVVDILVKAIKEAVHEPGYVKFCTERNARWEYIPPEKMVPLFDKRRIIVREILSKAGILKESK
ncbi:MAG: tripartite tricarboxylate transporter substrate binding protein [Thermodesulfobacteriota bacterium]|jgi:tripartite-type tricarboxylate transporter receptor subunit TctC